MKWRYFLVAILVIGYAMIAAGAPPLPVAAGLVLAAVMNFYQGIKTRDVRSKKNTTTAL